MCLGVWALDFISASHCIHLHFIGMLKVKLFPISKNWPTLGWEIFVESERF